MLNKISGLARALYILLAIVAGFVTLGSMDVVLVIIALGLISGVSMSREKMVPAGVTALVLPIVGAALGHIPMAGAHLTAATANLQMGVAGALAAALTIAFYEIIMDGVMGLAGNGSASAAAPATR